MVQFLADGNINSPIVRGVIRQSLNIDVDVAQCHSRLKHGFLLP